MEAAHGEAFSDLSPWFDANDEIAESVEVMGQGGYGKTLTMVTPAISADDDGTADCGWHQPRFTYLVLQPGRVSKARQNRLPIARYLRQW